MARLVLPLLLLLSTAGFAEEKKATEPDRYLLDWIEGKAVIRLRARFHATDPRSRGAIDRVLEALASHRDDDIVRVAVETLTGRYRGVRYWQRENLKDLVRRNGEAASIERLTKLLGHETNAIRRLAAETLGWSARREAVAPLLGGLKDKDPDVCKAARKSLHRLSGNKEKWPDFEKLLGKNGEKLDLSKAKRWPTEEKKPGVYRLGR